MSTCDLANGASKAISIKMAQPHRKGKSQRALKKIPLLLMHQYFITQDNYFTVTSVTRTDGTNKIVNLVSL